MPPLQESTDVVALVTMLLIMLMTVQDALQTAVGVLELEQDTLDPLTGIAGTSENLQEGRWENVQELSLAASASLHCWRLFSSHLPIPGDLEFWVKPWSTTWFSRFVVEQYDDQRWVQHFRMTKGVVIKLAELLSPHVQKRNTNYRLAVPVLVRVACTLFKLAQGASLTICSELFAVGVSTVSEMLYDVVRAINVVFRSEISWPTGRRLSNVQHDFKELCGLPSVVGAIDGTDIRIAKPAMT